MKLFRRKAKKERECRIPDILQTLASLLDRFDYKSQSDALLSLRDWYSADPDKFRHEITTNKYYWLGMGTIADICLCDSEADFEFRRLYCELANECERFGFRSIYSYDVATVYGKWTSNSAQNKPE